MSKVKKNLSIIMALALTGSLIGNTVYALADPDGNGVLNADDFFHLVSVFHGKQESSSGDDVNGDGVVNIMDAVTLKSEILENDSTGNEVTDGKYPATEQYVKLIGRTLHKNDVTWLVHSGAAAEFTVTASKASVTLAGDGCVHSEEKYRPRYAVFVDGELIEDKVLDTEEKEIELFSGSTKRTATVKVIHLSEANNGAIGVKSINAGTGSSVKPTPNKKYLVEFIGDSITCGYGVEAKSNGDQFSTSTENFMKSYAYLAAEQIGVDYSAVSYSGYGVTSGYTSDAQNRDQLVPDYYNYVGRLDDYKVAWDFDRRQPDAVVINLGTNDSSYVSKDVEGRSADFEKDYYDFLTQVREKNPDAAIVCTVGTMGGDEVYAIIEKTVEKYISQTGDKKISYFHSTVQNPANGYGADWHPSEKTQQLSAYVMADKLCDALGIPSDKIGLNAVEEAEYEMIQNKDNGVNASSYLGYDKSFWINSVTAGKELDDLQAYIAPLDLNPGGKFVLSFDYSGSVSEFSVKIQQNYGEKEVYFSDIVKAGSGTDKKQYSAEITLDQNDDNCALVIGIGGQDNSQMTLSNVSLMKVSN